MALPIAGGRKITVFTGRCNRLRRLLLDAAYSQLLVSLLPLPTHATDTHSHQCRADKDKENTHEQWLCSYCH